MNRLTAATLAIVALVTGAASNTHAAGVLTPRGGADAAIRIKDHSVNVTINNGFARTEVTQTFFNPNGRDLEALYSFPLPESASLSELTIFAGERELRGEVLAKEQALQAYQEEKSAGRDAGLAVQDAFRTFDFAVSPVKANAETRIRFVYYQPVKVDTGIGRYVYPLRDGGTDLDADAAGFWDKNAKVDGSFRADIELKSAFPVTDVRLPGFEQAAQVQKLADGHHKVSLEAAGATLDKDLVVYFRLADDLPGRVELVAHRADPGQPGTFMLVVTPGDDLPSLDGKGSDFTFLIDVSGSMKDKLATLASGVSRSLGQLNENDRFRIVTFDDRAVDVLGGYRPATRPEVDRAAAAVGTLKASGNTNLFDGLSLALQGLDAGRVTSLILVTDGVANVGEVDPARFHNLMRQFDVRVFGFLMGNSANWPLMRTICDASGGFYAPVSTGDDLIGQVLLAKSKLGSETLHDAKLEISGGSVRVFDTGEAVPRKIFRGQQLVVFGRYDRGGPATVTLAAKLTGQDKVYRTTFNFPEVEPTNPELERLWAMSRIEDVRRQVNRGALPPSSGEALIRDLGVQFSLVTDFTSMVVMSDDGFARRGVDRRNLERSAIEQQAQLARAAQPARNNRVDQSNPAFAQAAPDLSNRPQRDRSPGPAGPRSGGAVDPFSGAVVLALAGAAVVAALRSRRTKRAAA